MADKPSSLPEWASSASYPAGPEPEAGTPTIVEPTSGQKQTGFRPGATASAQLGFNWYRNLVYQWIEYLSDGALEGNHSIDGDLSVTGAAHVTGDVYHGEQSITVSASAFVPAGGAPTLGDTWDLGTPPNDIIQANVPLRGGDRIKSIVWHRDKGGNAAPLAMSIRTRNGDANADVDTLSDVTSASGFSGVEVTGIDYTIDPDDAVFLRVQGGSADHAFSHATIVYDRPTPP